MRANSRRSSSARHRIERAERFVHQQNRRIDGERARERRRAAAGRRTARAAGAPAYSRAGSPTRSSSSCTRARACGRPATARAGARRRRSPRRVMCGKRPTSCKHVADAPPQADAVPVARVAPFDDAPGPMVGSSSRLTSLRIVLLPAPLRPTSASTSPDVTPNETSRRTGGRPA